MSRTMRTCSLVLILLLVPVGSALAQGAATAEMHVSVRDPNGAAVTNATVTVRDEAKNFERSTANNVNGEYALLLLPPGTYTVTVVAPGFSKVVAQNVAITVGQAAEVPITLQVARVTETVTVTTEAEMVETQQTSSTSTIEERRIENLPINGRNYINFTLTNSQAARDTAPSIGAAPTSGLNFGGQRARSNLVNVDGADAVDNSVNGIRSTVSQEAVQEFQIITNSYTAEYGRAAGGVINIITKSGTNAFHGSAYGYLRNRRLQAVNP
ncbi:MAG TPA: carboxypeptidase regulatory-like domain-containing protein, partial [Terriglobales bacterium]|nr:carboxypeptidase regulatory-like domain-containing protein [Terriglobales bacterium]